MEGSQSEVERIANYVDGGWSRATGKGEQPVFDPATGRVVAHVPLSSPGDVDRAVAGAAAAFADWRRTPAGERVQPLFRLKTLLEERFEELARCVTLECGKTLAEARGEVRRGIDNVEVACGAPSLLQGASSEDIARGIDEHVIRQPLGVVAAITPFNFPAMIPLWFLPYAVACGNALVLKPSEKVPLTARLIVELVHEAGIPAGVVQLVNGAQETVEALVAHPDVRAVSFVGSSPVARAVYARATAAGKRAQCQGGAKNPVVVLPDADTEHAGRAVLESAFGCAGQRCLAASSAITVGAARERFTDALVELARGLRVGSGLEDGVDMGPVIRPATVERVRDSVGEAVAGGARLLVDGREPGVPGDGFFVGPTILDRLPADSRVDREEIFGPVFGLTHVDGVDDAIALVNRRAYGNMACLFTRDGAAARRFRYEAQAGNIGINVGVAAPMAFFPFSGWKDSFFGDLHAQGRDAIDFYTDKKVVVERWP